MHAAACEHANPPGSRFCLECGQALGGHRCSRCHADLPVGAKFCNQCGAVAAAAEGPAPRSYTPRHLAEKILSSRSALEGERKHVTVLFADVKGSMELAEQVDPEEWHRILDRFFQILAEGVHRFEGTVNQFTGDGIMALFGAPIAHEDHAQRGCWTALHLREPLRRYADELRLTRGLSFSVRMGLNSGEVVVGRIGDDLRMDWTAQGHTVGLAQRMEQIAAPDRAYLTEHTARQVTGLFRLRDLGPMTVKGASGPLRVYELEDVGPLRTRFDVARMRGLSRFVGREQEMAVLEAALARALDGHGQMVGIVAEPGVGKSRLCHEFAERCRARGMPVHVGHAVAYGKAVPLLPWMELLRTRYGVTEHDGDEAARDKIAGRMLRLDPGLDEAVPVMFEFLGVPDPARPAPRLSPEAMQRELVGILRRLVRGRARRGEFTLSVMEDLHWLDAGSEAILAALSEVIPESPSLVLCTFRPEYHAVWMRKSHYEQVALQPLGPDALVELLGDLLGNDPSLDGLAKRIHERTGGNPFFIEEVVQALVEAGSLVGQKGAYRLVVPVEEIAVPASVQAVLAARIDRLSDRDKAVLQTAAVIGREFPEPVLERVAGLPQTDLGAALGTLTTSEFLYETMLHPEVEYAFKHPLTQEVAYHSQLSDRRAAVHAAAARTIAELYPHKLDERAALLAYHWERAGDARAAAEWHRRAADWVGSRDRAEMVRHWRQVRMLLRDVPESPETLALGILARRNLVYNAYVLGHVDEETSALFTEGMDLAKRLGDPGACVRLLNSYGNVLVASGAVDEGLSHHRESLRLADASGIRFLRFVARVPLAAVLSGSGPLGESLALSEEAEALGKDEPALETEVGTSPYGMLLAQRAWTLACVGRLPEAARAAERAVEIGRARRDTEVLQDGLRLAGFVCGMAGDAEGALAHARQTVAIAEAHGTVLARVLALAALGDAQLESGAWSQAAEALEGALALMRQHRTALWVETQYLALLAEAYLGAGDLARAGETVAQALAIGRQRRTPVYEIRALLAHARVLLTTRGPEAAADVDATLGDAMALVAATEAHVYVPFLHVERGRLAQLTGNNDARQLELREAQRLFAAMGAPLRAERLAKELNLP